MKELVNKQIITIIINVCINHICMKIEHKIDPSLFMMYHGIMVLK